MIFMYRPKHNRLSEYNTNNLGVCLTLRCVLRSGHVNGS